MTEALTLDAITHDQAAANIEAFAREKRLVQGNWQSDQGGKHLACLLGSIHPSINSATKCPAHLMPGWLARLTVRLFDGVPTGRIFEYGEAYADRLHRWGVLDAEAWERVRRTFITDVFGGAIADAQAKLGDNTPDFWPELKALSDQLLTLLLVPATPWRDYIPIRDAARILRGRAWSNYYAARCRRKAAAEAEAVEAVEAVAEAAVAEAVAEAAVAAVAAAVAVAAEAVAEAAVAEAVAARSTSHARSFDLLLHAIDVEIELAA